MLAGKQPAKTLAMRAHHAALPACGFAGRTFVPDVLRYRAGKFAQAGTTCAGTAAWFIDCTGRKRECRAARANGNRLIALRSGVHACGQVRTRMTARYLRRGGLALQCLEKKISVHVNSLTNRTKKGPLSLNTLNPNGPTIDCYQRAIILRLLRLRRCLKQHWHSRQLPHESWPLFPGPYPDFL